MDFEVGFDWEGYWIEAKCKFVDTIYGADADGNRGEARCEVEDFDIHVWPSDDEEHKGIEIPWEKVNAEDRKAIEKYALEKLTEEASEYDDWDGDCDDKDD